MEHNKALDGLRGFALFAVLLSHSPVFLLFSPLSASYQSWVEGGAFGVDLFFVLSGFLITTGLIEMRQRRGAISLKTFFVRRATRLLPALYTLLVVYTVVKLVDGVPLSTMWPALLAAVFYYTNILPSLSMTIPFDLVPLWSLAVEEQFYLVWPFAMMLLVRRGTRVALGVLLAVFVAFGTWRAYQLRIQTDDVLSTFIRTDLRIDGLIIGAITAFAVRTFTIRREAAQVLAALGGAFVLVFVTFCSVKQEFATRFGLTFFNIAAAMIIVSVVSHDTVFAKALSFRPLAALGRYSYGVYLWHLPIWVFVVQHLHVHFRPLHVATSLVLTVFVTTMSWRFVEQPAMRLRSRILQ